MTDNCCDKGCSFHKVEGCELGMVRQNGDCIFVSDNDWHDKHFAFASGSNNQKINIDEINEKHKLELEILRDKCRYLRKRARTAFEKGRQKESDRSWKIFQARLLGDCELGLRTLEEWQGCKSTDRASDQRLLRTLNDIFIKWKTGSVE